MVSQQFILNRVHLRVLAECIEIPDAIIVILARALRQLLDMWEIFQMPKQPGKHLHIYRLDPLLSVVEQPALPFAGLPMNWRGCCLRAKEA